MESLRFLLERGADANALNNDGYTPAHFVVERDDNQILKGLKYLDKYRADFTIKNHSNETPLLLLMYVCVLRKFDYLKCAKYLILKTLLHLSRKEDLETSQIDPTLETLIKRFHEPLLSYYQQAVSEIVEMKTDKAFHDISVLEIANAGALIDEIETEGTSHLYMINHIMQQLAKNAYPVFGGVLADLLSRRNMEENLNQVRMSSMLEVSGNQTEITLPSPCLLHIAGYLPIRDLMNLNLASYGTWKSDVTEFDMYSTEIGDIFKKRQLPERSKWFKDKESTDDEDDSEFIPSSSNTSDYTSDDNGSDDVRDASDDDNGSDDVRDASDDDYVPDDVRDEPNNDNAPDDVEDEPDDNYAPNNDNASVE